MKLPGTGSNIIQPGHGKAHSAAISERFSRDRGGGGHAQLDQASQMVLDCPTMLAALLSCSVRCLKADGTISKIHLGTQ
jgi:hypothetical protein